MGTGIPTEPRIPMVVRVLSYAAQPIVAWAEGMDLSGLAAASAPPSPEQSGALLQAFRVAVEPRLLERFAAAVRGKQPDALWALSGVAWMARGDLQRLLNAIGEAFQSGDVGYLNFFG